MKNYLKQVWKSIVLWLFNFAYTQIFKLVDTNQDGMLSDEEIKASIVKLKELIKKLKE
jgi:hypothetical protein